MRRLMLRRLVAKVPARGAVFWTFDLGIIRLHSDHLDLWSSVCSTSRTPTKERLPAGVTGGTPHSQYPMTVRGLQAPVSVVATSGIGWTYRKIPARPEGRLRRRSGAHQPETPQN